MSFAHHGAVIESLVTVSLDWCLEPLRKVHLPVVTHYREASDGIHLVETELSAELVRPFDDTLVCPHLSEVQQLIVKAGK